MTRMMHMRLQGSSVKAYGQNNCQNSLIFFLKRFNSPRPDRSLALFHICQNRYDWDMQHVLTTNDLSKGGENTAVISWLFTVAAMVFTMVVVGGITRLTGSGLSMVEWRPLMGILPPLSDSEWMRVYDLYRESPEFIHINTHMGVAEFKTIFFWEYVHRVLGRLIGLAYGVPLLYFAIRRRIPHGYGWRFVILLCLGGMQGVIGWWMVKSGLAEDPAVSQYRLAVHLSMALLILAALLWTAFDLKDGRSGWPGGMVPVFSGCWPLPSLLVHLLPAWMLVNSITNTR